MTLFVESGDGIHPPTRDLVPAPELPLYYDYENQAWVRNGVYLDCGHRFQCGCYGRKYEGHPAPKEIVEEYGRERREPSPYDVDGKAPADRIAIRRRTER